MFSLADTPVKFIGLLVLFAWCTAWCVYELTRPQDVRQRVSNSLHLVMAAVMLLMVAPVTWTLLTDVVPTFGLVAVFAASTAWFGWLAFDARRAAGRAWLHFVGHAAMFAAMTWHLSAMGLMEARMASGGMGGMDSGSDMGGMGMGSAANPMAPGGVMWVFALVGLPLMAYLLGSSVRSLWLAAQPADALASATCPCGPGCDCGPDCSCYATHDHAAAPAQELVVAGAGATPSAHVVVAPVVSTRTCHEVRPVGSRKFRLESLAAFAMNGGMFWMSTGLLVPILPFFAALAF